MFIREKAAPRQKDNGIAKRHYKSSHFQAKTNPAIVKPSKNNSNE
jgi:hypothetical protein